MSDEQDLTPLEKAAVVLMSLGKEQAAEVMKFLSESEVKKLSRAFMGVREVGREAQHEIAGEFHRMLQAAETVVVDGQEFARDVIASAFGEDSGEMLLDYITGSRKEPLGTIINEVPENILETFVGTEHPQTIAFLLSKMRADKAAELLGKMSEEMQVDVMVRLSQLNTVKSDIIDEVREVFRSQLRGVGLSDQEELGGTKSAADILNFVDRSAEERILTEMEETYPDLSDEIRNLMFTFEDVLKLDDRAVQTVLKEVPREELVLALKTASEELKSLLFRNISQRAAQMLAEDLETLGPTKLKDVEKAQQGIIDIIRKLESEGKIAVAGGGDDVLV
jgi:flagellar motor switch protein FliG